MTRWKRAAGRLWRATACGAILATPAACAGGSAGDFCRLYAPVYTAREDTEETREAADANNAVWLELCAPAEDQAATAP